MNDLLQGLTHIQFCLFYNFQKRNTFSSLAEPSQAGSISVFGAITGAQYYSEVMGFNRSSTHRKSNPPPSSRYPQYHCIHPIVLMSPVAQNLITSCHITSFPPSQLRCPKIPSTAFREHDLRAVPHSIPHKLPGRAH